jgi:hypothetical protein
MPIFLFIKIFWLPDVWNENFQWSPAKVRQPVSCFGIMGVWATNRNVGIHLFPILWCSPSFVIIHGLNKEIWASMDQHTSSSTTWIQDSWILTYCFQGLMGGCTHCHFTLSPARSYLALLWTWLEPSAQSILSHWFLWAAATWQYMVLTPVKKVRMHRVKLIVLTWVTETG